MLGCVGVPGGRDTRGVERWAGEGEEEVDGQRGGVARLYQHDEQEKGRQGKSTGLLWRAGDGWKQRDYLLHQSTTRLEGGGGGESGRRWGEEDEEGRGGELAVGARSRGFLGAGLGFSHRALGSPSLHCFIITFLIHWFF